MGFFTHKMTDRHHKGIFSCITSRRPTLLQKLSQRTPDDISSREIPRSRPWYRCRYSPNFRGLFCSTADLQLDQEPACHSILPADSISSIHLWTKGRLPRIKKAPHPRDRLASSSVSGVCVVCYEAIYKLALMPRTVHRHATSRYREYAKLPTVLLPISIRPSPRCITNRQYDCLMDVCIGHADQPLLETFFTVCLLNTEWSTEFRRYLGYFHGSRSGGRFLSPFLDIAYGYG